MQRTSRKRQVLEASYRYVLREGIVGLSLRPLAAEVGSSASVLRYLFGSKDELVRSLLVRAGRDERLLLVGLLEEASLGEQATALWRWLSAPAHRPLLRLWVQVYAASLVEPDGPWHGFAQDAVQGWLDVLAAAQPPEQSRHRRADADARRPAGRGARPAGEWRRRQDHGGGYGPTSRSCREGWHAGRVSPSAVGSARASAVSWCREPTLALA